MQSPPHLARKLLAQVPYGVKFEIARLINHGRIPPYNEAPADLWFQVKKHFTTNAQAKDLKTFFHDAGIWIGGNTRDMEAPSEPLQKDEIYTTFYEEEARNQVCIDGAILVSRSDAAHFRVLGKS